MPRKRAEIGGLTTCARLNYTLLLITRVYTTADFHTGGLLLTQERMAGVISKKCTVFLLLRYHTIGQGPLPPEAGIVSYRSCRSSDHACGWPVVYLI